MSADYSQQWQWQETGEGRYLTCTLLANWHHGFFTNHFPKQFPEQLINNLHSSAQVYRLKQIHSDIVFTTEQIDRQLGENPELQRLDGDGILTSKPQQSVWSASADCTPILIADRHSGAVSAVHSGWRGTASKVSINAIETFINAGSKKEDLLFALGPAIAGKVYQVNEEVAAKVVSTVVENSGDMTPSEIINQANQLDSSLVLPDVEEDKAKLDVTKTIYWQLRQAGIEEDKISIAPYCTYQNPDDFYSYRRSRIKQNQWSGIVSN